MAEIVGAVGVPHTPMFPALVAREGPESETARLYASVAQHLEAVQPDLIVAFDSDHLNTFFFDNLPTFCVGVADEAQGPNDGTPGLPAYTVPLSPERGASLHAHALEQGFDPAQAQELTLDHSLLVPLHFLTPHMRIPVVPVFVNGLAPPLPSARRCFALGEAVRQAARAWPRAERVAVLASGSFSLEVAGPKANDGASSGVPDPGWMDHVVRRLTDGGVAELLEEATTDRMLRAGNVAGELLNWIALLGVVGDRRPVFVEPQRSHGHAYAAWRWD